MSIGPVKMARKPRGTARERRKTTGRLAVRLENVRRWKKRIIGRQRPIRTTPEVRKSSMLVRIAVSE